MQLIVTAVLPTCFAFAPVEAVCPPADHAEAGTSNRQSEGAADQKGPSEEEVPTLAMLCDDNENLAYFYALRVCKWCDNREAFARLDKALASGAPCPHSLLIPMASLRPDKQFGLGNVSGFLRHASSDAREMAAHAIGAIGRHRGAAEAEVLYDAIRTEGNEKVRSAILVAVAHVAPSERATRDAVEAGTENPSRSVRQAAVEAIGYLDPSVPDVITLCAAALRRDDVLSEALAAAGRLGPAAASCAETVAECFDHSNVEIRFHAASTLSRLGRDDVPVRRALLHALHDPASAVRAEAARAIGVLRLTGADERRALELALSDESSDARLAAAVAIARCDGDKRAVVAEVKRVVFSKETPSDSDHSYNVSTTDEQEIWQALKAAHNVRIPPSEIAEALTACLAHRDERIRNGACFLLADAGAAGAVAIVALTDLLGDENELVQAAARRALQSIHAACADSIRQGADGANDVPTEGRPAD